MNYVLNRVRLNQLTRHPLNIKLYGYELEPSFLASVKRHGIICPIQVTQDFIIVDGHKRYHAAIEAGIAEAHMIVRLDLNDELSIQEALIECNRHRDRSDEVKHHEAQVLLSIKQDRIKERETIQGRREALAVGAEEDRFQYSNYWWDIDP